VTDLHPTSAALLQTTIALLDERAPEDITLEQVLTTAGVSKGSMYHHYRDFAELMDRALVVRFRDVVDATILAVRDVVIGAGTVEHFRGALLDLLRVAQGPEQRGRRARHVWLLSQAGTRESMRAELSVEQQRLTDGLAESLGVAREFGWLPAHLDPRALVVLAQSVAVGRVVDDVVEHRVDAAAWDALVTVLVDAVVVPSAATVQATG
jgi:AcrR family transcriptional regulator